MNVAGGLTLSRTSQPHIQGLYDHLIRGCRPPVVHLAPPGVAGTVSLSGSRDRLVTRAKTVVSIIAAVMKPSLAAGGFARY